MKERVCERVREKTLTLVTVGPSKKVGVPFGGDATRRMVASAGSLDGNVRIRQVYLNLLAMQKSINR